MCLEIVCIIAPSAEQSVSAGGLAKASGLSVSSIKFEGKKALHLSRTGGCSCDFLAENAGHEAEHWALDAEGLPSLVAAIKHLSGAARRFSVVAHWLGGDTERSALRIGVAELAKLVQRNHLGNNLVYHVGHDG